MKLADEIWDRKKGQKLNPVTLFAVKLADPNDGKSAQKNRKSRSKKIA